MSRVWTGMDWRPKPPMPTVRPEQDQPRPVACCPEHVLNADRIARAIEAAQEVLDAKNTSLGARRTAKRILGVLTGQDLTSASRIDGDVA